MKELIILMPFGHSAEIKIKETIMVKIVIKKKIAIMKSKT
jgi:hypothetical protein